MKIQIRLLAFALAVLTSVAVFASCGGEKSESDGHKTDVTEGDTNETGIDETKMQEILDFETETSEAEQPTAKEILALDFDLIIFRDKGKTV